MNDLQKKIGYTFKNPKLLQAALVHSSYVNENRNKVSESNERLEFLGDSVLGFISADYLYKKYPGRPEGELTRERASLVCEKSLHRTALELGLGELLLLGKGEAMGGGRQRPSILADAVEATLAAIYLDGGMEPARRFVYTFILQRQESPDTEDYKTELQELVQREKEQALEYRIVGESGPDHDKHFIAQVLLNGKMVGQGEGRTKKMAEQMSAKAAIAKLFR